MTSIRSFVVSIALMTPLVATGATLTIADPDAKRPWAERRIEYTSVERAGGYHLVIKTDQTTCLINKAAADEAGYSLGLLQLLIASSNVDLAITC